MFNNQLDHEIRSGLKAATDHIEASKRCKDRVDARINSAEASTVNGGINNMKRWTLRRIAIVVAVCCLFVGTTVFAGGKIAIISSHSSSFFEKEDYNDIAEIEKEAGFNISAVKTFSNGFAMQSVQAVDNEGQDSDGNTVTKWKGIHIAYKDPQNRTIAIFMEPAAKLKQDLSKNNLAKKTIDEVTVYYDCIEMHLVPPDYRPSEEEQARSDNDPHYTISYGVAKETTEINRVVTFSKDGVVYCLSSFDTVTEDELFSMAEEIIGK